MRNLTRCETRWIALGGLNGGIMSEISERFHRIAGGFTARVVSVSADAWDNPSPCLGWVARDVVRHLTEWVPPFLADGAGVAVPVGPSVDADPVGAWQVFSDGLGAMLSDPAIAASDFDHPRAGRRTLEDAIAQFILGDILVHTWDLARATGLDETLHPDEVASMVAGLEPFGDDLEKSGHYGPRLDVDEGADAQTRLLALTGRRA